MFSALNNISGLLSPEEFKRPSLQQPHYFICTESVINAKHYKNLITIYHKRIILYSEAVRTPS